MIQVHYSRTTRAYHGPELRPHFLLTEFGLRGSALAAFIGPCDVETDHLVDWEDRLENEHIRAASMVHFLGEFFGSTLREGVLRQRLIMATFAQTLNDALERSDADLERYRISRSGDDLFSDGRKLSVSIVTASPVSQLLHVGINIDPAGAPVAAIGLAELGISVEGWISAVLTAFSEEWSSIEWACVKVRPVI